MAKLSTVTDRIQVAIECAGCGKGIRASGETFDAINAKLTDNGYGLDANGKRICRECTRGIQKPEEAGRDDADFADEVGDFDELDREQ